jgi:outer membrane receptor protein involved in Fe transport
MMLNSTITADRGRIYGLSIIFSLVFLSALCGQTDSSMLLLPEKLSDTDVRVYDIQSFREKIISATLVEEDPLDLPYSTWVITAEEIGLYGFSTLGDVLKAAPGLRVSQPGTAQEGETFRLLGLSGNQYVKILLNGVPIKPGMALGMPIAAQLPIRQAERVELLYGSAGAFLYGNEACVGVINIIIKESERPVYTQADLVFGSLGLNSLDLTLGGKLFKGKNIGKFSLYGSSTVRANSDLFWDNSIRRPANYLPAGFSMSDLAGFSNIQVDSLGALPRLAPAQQESRMFGAQVEWRGFRFQFHRMNRSEAAFLGVSPLAMAYTALGNSFRDRLEAYSLQYARASERSHIFAAVSIENYEVENTSSARYGFDRLRQFRYWAFRADTLADASRRLFLQQEDSLFSAGQRFMAAQGLDLRMDLRFRWKMGNRLWWDTGVLLVGTAGNPLSSYYTAPPVLGDKMAPVDLRVNASVQLYSGLDWQGRRFRWMAGMAATPLIGEGVLQEGGTIQMGYAPRLAVQFKIDSVQRVYANYSKSFRAFQEAQASMSYTFNSSQQVLYTGGEYARPLEQLESFFLGYRFRKSELIGFWQKGSNLLRDGYLIYTLDNQVLGGYQSVSGLGQRLWGAQLRLVFEKSTQTQLRQGRSQRQVLWRAEYWLQRTEGKEYFGFGLQPTEEIRNFPEWMSQARLSGTLSRLQFSVLMNRQGSTLPLATPFLASWKRSLPKSRIPGYSTWDFQARFFVNKHFLLLFGVQNLLNRSAYGIDLSGGPEDQLLPLQQGRLWRFGVNYNMN